MARYTCSFIVTVPLDQIQPLLIEILQSCNFDITHKTHDYLMARENPGQVHFSKLVNVEALIDITTATDYEVRVNFVIKNEELPLQIDNHCRQMFDLVQQEIIDNYQWQLEANVSG
ncbi:MAG: hypothetical protein F6K10_33145 [Moorea sp. SIO2B7]|nr:hypothetical protein [Moorena sp. SIO2B7]